MGGCWAFYAVWGQHRPVLPLEPLSRLDIYLPVPLCPLQLQMKEGETFESETDTEVIPKLCKFLYRWA